MSGLPINIDDLTGPSTAPCHPSALADDILAALAKLPDIPSEGDRSSGDVLVEAMRYSLGLRGKRARGLLVLLTADGWGEHWQTALDCAHAVEMVHTASLIVDDLPSMDDASTRRGEPTNHVKFGEPAATLASIALLSEALRKLSASAPLSPDQRSLAVACLASAIGPEGMAAGQMRDLAPAGDTLADVELTHVLKTGSLFAAAAELGCIVAGIEGPRKWMLSDYGMLLGKAFQEFDDLIDLSAAPQVAGKDAQQDTGKPTVVALIGRDAAERRALRQVELALECLEASCIAARELRRYTLDLTRAMRKTVAESRNASNKGA